MSSISMSDLANQANQWYTTLYQPEVSKRIVFDNKLTEIIQIEEFQQKPLTYLKKSLKAANKKILKNSDDYETKYVIYMQLFKILNYIFDPKNNDVLLESPLGDKYSENDNEEPEVKDDVELNDDLVFDVNFLYPLTTSKLAAYIHTPDKTTANYNIQQLLAHICPSFPLAKLLVFSSDKDSLNLFFQSLYFPQVKTIFDEEDMDNLQDPPSFENLTPEQVPIYLFTKSLNPEVTIQTSVNKISESEFEAKLESFFNNFVDEDAYSDESLYTQDFST